jgi:hypothetical protein
VGGTVTCASERKWANGKRAVLVTTAAAVNTLISTTMAPITGRGSRDLRDASRDSRQRAHG